MTERLYHADAYLRRFRSTVLAHAHHDGRPSLVLAATAFYPEAGGQMADRGTLGGRPVLDVQVDAAGDVHHVVDGERPAVGAEVEGAIDWARRRVHMALHTGQHLLSRTLIEAAGAETVSARLGESDCTIDVARDGVPERELAAAEALANAIVDDDLPVRAWFPAPGELAALPLRREPKVASEVRVVAIGDVDYSPCGGTHCASSAQIGPLRVLAAERYKGLTRIHFAAGARARGIFAEHGDVLARLARELTCAPAEVPATVERLRRALADSRAEAAAARDQLAALLARALLATATADEIVATVPEAALLRPVATHLVAAGKDALLAAATADGTQVVLARAAGSALDCGALLRRLAQAAGGRGGGRPEHAEGRLPPATDWPTAVGAARS